MSDIVERLQACGTRRIVASVFEFMNSDHSWHTQRDIERKADLRQPEVSTALKELAPYIEIRKLDHNEGNGKGRHISEFMMSEVSSKAFIETIINNAESEARIKEAALEKLRELIVGL